MPTHLTEALVLRVIDIGEADQVIHLLTPDLGRVAAMAKSARKSRKRFPGTLDLLNHLDVELQRRPRRMTHLGRARLVTPYLALRAHPARFALACYLAELLGRMAPEGSAGGDAQLLFDFAVDALRQIERREPDTRLRLFLQLESLCALGLRPELRDCVRCGNELRGSGAFAFHLGDGGVHCSRCRAEESASLPVHLPTLRTLERGLQLGLAGIDRLAVGAHAGRDLREADQLVGRFHRFHVGLELRSEAFLREAFATAPRIGGGGATGA